jgi:hypothetical protein
MKEDSLMREWKWEKRGRPRELYFDETCVDAPVLPEFPVPMCDCGVPAGVDQSYFEDTAARAYYCCNDYRVSAVIVLSYLMLLVLFHMESLMVITWNAGLGGMLFFPMDRWP